MINELYRTIKELFDVNDFDNLVADSIGAVPFYEERDSQISNENNYFDAGIGTILSAVTSLVGAFNAPEPPSPAPPPPPPAPAPAPEAPEVSTAPEASNEPVVDTEAAKIRAQKRRKAESDQKMYNLSSDDDSSVSLTKSILGE